MSGDWSLARRLSGALILGIAVLWIAAVLAAVVVVRHETNEVFDSALQEMAQRLLPLAIDDLRDDDDDGREIDHAAAVPEHEEYLVYQLRDATGRVLLRSHDAPPEPFPVPLRPGFTDAEGWRAYTERTADGRLYIQVLDRQTHRSETLLEFVVWLVAPLALLIPLAGLIIVLAVRRVLAPIAGVREAIRERGGSDLAPIPGDGMPMELAPIVDDVNRLMQRLSKALESERSFAANSAHELRTPVAAALAQLSRLAEETRGSPGAARVDRIADILRGLARTVEKLLQLARAEAGIALRREPVDLVQVAELLVEEFRRDRRYADRVRLDVRTDQDVLVLTDIDAIAIAVRNLIENALVHGSAREPVIVSVAPDRSIRVVNAGPAVPPERLAVLTGRFERGAGKASGSGLGLAIVDSIVRQAGGSLELRSPAPARDSGFEAVIRLPGSS
ncbi:MAG: ATP-binding protein [Thalassobaculum sp.]|uniref:HAMP domain-containing sensor histidine kinase n=1 Tax=Thalassobaculum sp. TaxID=2022740 RepID=UPI0032EB825E